MPGSRARPDAPLRPDGLPLDGGPHERQRPPGFADAAPPGGYTWWYVDGVSDDGRFGVTVIAFVGSVFSPRYARARARGPADSGDFCAFNVAVYGPGVGRWAMTEWPRAAVQRDAQRLRIGTNEMRWDGDQLVIDVDECTAPWRKRVSGTVKLTPRATFDDVIELDAHGRHHWCPVAPLSRIEVVLERPSLSFSGTGYHDANAGAEGLEDGFRRWTWSRAASEDRCAVLYDAIRRDGSALCFGRSFGVDGSRRDIDPPERVDLPSGGWGVFRATRCDAGAERPRVVQTLEDTPFYTRSLIATTIDGRRATAVHESVSLERFRRRWVRFLVPFRIRRGTVP